MIATVNTTKILICKKFYSFFVQLLFCFGILFYDCCIDIPGMVGVPGFTFKRNTTSERSTLDLVGSEGQIQVVRNHTDYV